MTVRKAPPKRRGYDMGGYVDPNEQRISNGSLGGSISSSFNSTLSTGMKAKTLYDKMKRAEKLKDMDLPNPEAMKLNDELTAPGGKPAIYNRGGKIKHTAGPRIGKDDGLIPAQKGEYVIRKSAVNKLGSKVLGQVNRGKLPTRRGR